MKIELTIEVNHCIQCPLRGYHRGHGESFLYCKHPNAPKGYENMIFDNDNKDGFPWFCPGRTNK